MQLTFEFKEHPSIVGRLFWSEGSSEPPNLRTPVFVPVEFLRTTPGSSNPIDLDTERYSQIWASLNCGASPTGIGSHLFPNLAAPLQESEKNLPIVRSFVDNLKQRLFLLHLPNSDSQK
jgi:hypothetical protein